MAEEITQNTFFKAMTSKKQFEGRSSELSFSQIGMILMNANVFVLTLVIGSVVSALLIIVGCINRK